jgi:hypothetical protein
MFGRELELLVLHDVPRPGEREADRASGKKRGEDRREKPVAFGKIGRGTLLDQARKSVEPSGPAPA